MPLTLSVDCSLRRIGLALSRSSVHTATVSLSTGPKQASVLPLLVEQLVSSAGAKISDISTIAVTVGPGFYTGIRVGVSYAAALAWSLGVGVVPVLTLEAMAMGAQELRQPVIAAVRVRAGEFSSAIYDDNGRVLAGPKWRTTDDLVNVVSAELRGRAVLVLCDDAERCAELSTLGAPIDGHVYVLAGLHKAAVARRPVGPEEVMAVYLRDPD